MTDIDDNDVHLTFSDSCIYCICGPLPLRDLCMTEAVTFPFQNGFAMMGLTFHIYIRERCSLLSILSSNSNKSLTFTT